MREAYRLSKQQHLYDKLDSTEKNFVLSIGYVGKEIHEYTFIEKKILDVRAKRR